MLIFICIVEEEADEDDDNVDDDGDTSTPNTTVLLSNAGTTTVDTSTITSGILRSKDLRSVVETKRRNFTRSRSNSDSEDNGSNYEMNRGTNRRQQTRSPTRPSSFQESGETIFGMINT